MHSCKSEGTLLNVQGILGLFHHHVRFSILVLMLGLNQISYVHNAHPMHKHRLVLSAPGVQLGSSRAPHFDRWGQICSLLSPPYFK
jgi:hypothetical protein